MICQIQQVSANCNGLAGDETCEALQRVLSKMLDYNSLSQEVWVPGADEGKDGVRLNVEWHLGGDLKLVLLMRGHSGCSSNKPCPFCTWNRSDPWAEADERTEADIAQATELAARYLPMVQAHKTLQSLQALKRDEAKLSSYPNSDTMEKIDAATADREACFKDLQEYMCENLSPSMLHNLNNPSLLQRLKSSLPSSCFSDPTKPGEHFCPQATALNEWLRVIQQTADNAVSRVERRKLL